MSERNIEKDTKAYLEEIQETVRKSKELLKIANGKIEETRQRCKELGIDTEQLKNLDINDIHGLPEELKRILADDQANWEQGIRELTGNPGPENPDEVRQNRLEKLGALKHPYRL